MWASLNTCLLTMDIFCDKFRKTLRPFPRHTPPMAILFSFVEETYVFAGYHTSCFWFEFHLQQLVHLILFLFLFEVQDSENQNLLKTRLGDLSKMLLRFWDWAKLFGDPRISRNQASPLQVACWGWSTLLFVCVHKLNNNKENTYLNCGKFPSSRGKNVNDGFINSWSLDSSKMLVISYQSWKFLIETNKNLPSKKEMRGAAGHCKYSGLPSSLPMYVKVYMS